MKKITKLILFVYANCAFANDAAIGIDGGDLYFKNLKGVSMQKETLYISMNLVRVQYEFFNNTNKTIRTHIGFPIKWIEDCGDKNFDPNSSNPLNFTAKINGKSIKTNIRKEGFEKLVPDHCDSQEVQITHYWEQEFFPKKTLRIEHSYVPTYLSSIGQIMKTEKGYNSEALVEKFCATKKQANWLTKKENYINHLHYILRSANTWDGPIKNFELILDKKGASKIFLCTDLNLKKVKGKNQFKAIKKNYVPKNDLDIAFGTSS